jgi:amidase
MNETVEALRKLGHELVEFPAPDAAQALAIFSSLSSSDGYKQLLAHLGPDPMEPSMSLVTLGSRIPVWLLWVASTFIKYGLKDPIFGDILCKSGCDVHLLTHADQSRAKSASEYMYWSGQRDDYIRAFRKNVS